MNPLHRDRILIDIDTLLDTRMGVLMQMNESLFADNVDEGYRVRNNDVWSNLFDGIDQAEYEERYRNRDEIALRNSRITNMVHVLIRLITDYSTTRMFQNRENDKLELIINLFPYVNLSKVEIHHILQCLTEYLGSSITLRVAFYDPMETPLSRLVSDGFTQYIMYDFNSWCKKHYSNSTDYDSVDRKQDFIIVAPRISERELTDAEREELRANGLEDHDPFELTSAIFAPAFQLEYLSTMLFSVIDVNFILGEVNEEDLVIENYPGKYV